MPDSQIPFYYQQLQKQQQDRQKLVETMAMQAMQSPKMSMVGWTPVGGGTPLDAVARIVQAYMAGKERKQLGQDAQALSEQYQADMQKALNSYLTTREGSTPADGVGPSMPGDPRRAAIEAVASQFPGLREIGMADLKGLGSSEIPIDKLFQYADPASIPAMMQQGVSAFRPKVQLQGMTPGQVSVDQGGRVVTPQMPEGQSGVGSGVGLGPSGQPVGPGWETVNIGGDLYQVSPSGMKKLDNAPRTTTNVSTTIVNPAETEFSKVVGRDAGGQVKILRENAANAQKTLSTLQKLDNLNTQGTFTGSTANIANFATNLAKTIGMPVSKEVSRLGANSEAYVSTLNSQIASYLTQGGGVGRSLTDADREAIASQFPTLVNTPEGRKRIVDMLGSAARRDIAIAEEAQSRIGTTFPDLGNVLTAVPVNTPEPAAAPATGGTISLEDYLKGARVRGN